MKPKYVIGLSLQGFPHNWEQPKRETSNHMVICFSSAHFARNLKQGLITYWCLERDFQMLEKNVLIASAVV